MNRVLPNLVLGIALLSAPVIAQISQPLPNSRGLKLLLYFPFDWAFILLSMAGFVALNSYVSARNDGSVWAGCILGVLLALAWSMVAFFVVAQLHLATGGTL